jgi:hypothetical protein
MAYTVRLIGAVIALSAGGVPGAMAQPPLAEVMLHHGVQVKGGYAAAFEAHTVPNGPVTAGSLAAPLALLAASAGRDRIDAAYAFGILAGRSGRAASPQQLAAAGQALVAMLADADRRSRIAGARVAGRVFAAPFDRSAVRPTRPAGLREALFAVLNGDDQVDQLIAMDALGLLREASAVVSLTERYHYYRQQNQRALAGGALEALARIGDPASATIITQAAADKWADGRDATALAVAFARQRVLQDGSIAVIRKALDDRSLRDQARGYLVELSASVP